MTLETTSLSRSIALIVNLFFLATAPIKRMYPYGPDSGDSEVPNTSEYSWRCFKIDVPDDGMQFFGKRHYHAYVCIQICS